MDYNSTLDIDPGFLEGTISEEGAVRCVFSTLEKIKVGTGTTTRRHLSKIYWYVEEIGNQRFSTRRLNANHVPIGEDKIIDVKTLMQKYTPEVEFFEDNTLPAMEQLEDHLEEGEQFREEGAYYSAEGSFNKALAIEEKNVRALFNLGIVYMELQNLDKARDMMKELLKIKASFLGKDQHLFNEFGISLRHNGLINEAVEYYSKALDYVKDDDHLYYNLARAHFESGDWEECVRHLRTSRALNPKLDVANAMAEKIVELAADPALCERVGKPPVPKKMAEGLIGMMEIDAPALVVKGKRQRLSDTREQEASNQELDIDF